MEFMAALRQSTPEHERCAVQNLVEMALLCGYYYFFFFAFFFVCSAVSGDTNANVFVAM